MDVPADKLAALAASGDRTPIPVEYLLVDVSLQLDDRSDAIFMLSFRTKDNHKCNVYSDKPDPASTSGGGWVDLQWVTSQRYSRFSSLNKILSVSAGNYISSEFPRKNTLINLGMKMSSKALEERRRALQLWLNEVMANFSVLPQEVRTDLISFMQLPQHLRVDLISKASLLSIGPAIVPALLVKEDLSKQQGNLSSTSNSTTLHPPNASEAPPQGSPNSTAKNRAKYTISSKRDSSTVVLPKEVQTLHKLSPIFLQIHNSAQAMHRSLVSLIFGKSTACLVLCISRKEALQPSAAPSLSAELYKIFVGSGLGYWLVAVSIILTTCTAQDFLSSSAPFELLVVSLLMYLVLLYREQWLRLKRNEEILGQNGASVQSAMREFFSLPSLRFAEYVSPLAVSHRMTSAVSRARKMSIKQSSPTPDKQTPGVVSSSASASAASNGDDPKILENSEAAKTLSSPAQEGHEKIVDFKSATLPTEKKIGVVNSQELRMNALENYRAMRTAFEEFEFPGISTAAKNMYLDRRFSHNFKLRGRNYLEDKKKDHPGPAVCKLMLLELYEVEAKDGDRHDHIASRQKVKERMEVISQLPGNPFQIIANFQIPGDPPVSIVTYFALPPYLGSELDDDGNPVPLDDAMEKFLALFGHFINIPVSEEERLATWGISSKKKVFSQSSKKRNKSSDERPSANDLRESSTDNPSVPISTELVVEQSEKVEDTDSEGKADGNELEPGTLTEQGFSGVAGAEPQKAAAAGNSWMQMPSDISWPDPHEPGALPQSDFRNARWKLIPSVTEGPWVVRTAVRSQPALLGRKVVQRYFRGSNYMEIDVHVGSSIIASQIVGVCRGYGKHFAADVGITIQGEENAELPEKMLGCASFHKIDIDIRQKVD